MTSKPRTLIGFLAAFLLGACAFLPGVRPQVGGAGGVGGPGVTPAGQPQAAGQTAGMSRISGSVRMLGETDATGIQVTAFETMAPPEAPGYEGLTDRAGAFSIAVPQGTYNLVARRPGFPYRGIRWRVQSGTIVDFDLVPTGGIAGTVSATPSAAGLDLTGAEIFVPGTDLDARANMEGRFELREVPIGTYSLAVRFAGYALGQANNVAVNAGSTTTAALTLVALSGGTTGSLSGQALLADDTNAAGVTVYATADNGATASVTTGFDGTYLFGELPATIVSLSFRKPGYFTKTLSVPVFVHADQGQMAIAVTLLPNYGTLQTLAGPTLGFAEGSAVNGHILCRSGGDLFVATSRSNSRVRKLGLTSGAFDILAGSDIGYADGVGTAARFEGINAIVADGNGDLYVSETTNQRIRKIVAATGTVWTLAGSSAGFADGMAGSAKFSSPRGMAVVGDYLYVADSGNNRIRRIALQTGEVSTLAGTGDPGNQDGSPATFASPMGLAHDGSGSLYVTDGGYGGIRRVNLDTGDVSTVAGGLGSDYLDGIGGGAKFSGPQGLALDGAGNLYVADSNNRRIRKVTVGLGEVTTVAGSGVTGLADGASDSAQFGSPTSLAFDSNGDLLVGDGGNAGVVRKVALATGEVSTLTLAGPARLRGDGGIAVGPEGTLYMGDAGAHRIRKLVLGATGTVTTSTLAGGLPGNLDALTGAAARLKGPNRAVVDAAGNVYFADSGNARIRMVVAANGEVKTLAGSTSGFADGIGTEAKFSGPTGLALDSSGNLYVADRGGHRIRKIVLATGEVSTLAGNGSLGSTDGSGTGAQFSSPWGLAVVRSDLYVADGQNHRIRKIVLGTGQVTTVAGSAAGFADGVGAAALFDTPHAIASDGAGRLFIADTSNSAIRLLTFGTGDVLTLAVRSHGLLDPTDLAVTASGSIFIYDRQAEKVFKLQRSTQ